jgi:Glycosyltransferase family 87
LAPYGAAVRLATWAAPPLSARALAVAVAAALAVLVLSFESAVRPVESVAGSDVTLYEEYGSRLLDGAMPYRDFPMEYPPGATAMFVLPATSIVEGGSGDAASWSPPNSRARRYYRGFTSLVLVLLATTLVVTALTLRRMQRPAYSTLLALAVVALSPLLIGQVLSERFDILPAALTAAALAVAVRGQYLAGAVFLGLGAATKVYPALLVPVLMLLALREGRVRKTVGIAATAAASALAVFLPFALVSPLGTWDSVRNQFRSGLQIESFPSSLLVMAYHAGEQIPALGLPSHSELKTVGAGGGLIRLVLAGPGVTTTENVAKALLVVALALLFWRLFRSTHDPREDLLRYSAGAVAILLVFGTVLSPQYIVWLVPLVPLVGGRRGLLATTSFVMAAGLTNVWIPERYFDYQGGLDAGPAALLLARNLALLVTAAVLVLPTSRVRSSWVLLGRWTSGAVDRSRVRKRAIRHTVKHGSDGTRTRDLRRDRPAF